MKTHFLTCLVLVLSLIFSVIPYGLVTPVHASEQKLVAFTFDDGPTGNTESLLDGLNAL